MPYHLAWATWLQRFATVVDVILLWLLWPAVLNGRSRLMWRLERRGKGWPDVLALTGRYVAGLAACLIPLGLAFSAATFPGEWLDEHTGNKEWIPPNDVTAWLGAKDEHDKPIWAIMPYLTIWSGRALGASDRPAPFVSLLFLQAQSASNPPAQVAKTNARPLATFGGTCP